MAEKEEEKIRLRRDLDQSQSSVSTLVSISGKPVISDPEKPGASDKARPAKGKSLSMLLFTCLLLFIAQFLQQFIDTAHLCFLANLSSFYSPDSQLQTKVDFASSLAPLDAPASKAVYAQLIADCEKKNGINSTHAAYAKLSYALALARSGELDRALSYAKPAIEIADVCKTNIPALSQKWCFKFQELANWFFYARREHDALDIYKASLASWDDFHFERGRKSDSEQRLAEIYGNNSDFDAAAQHMQNSYDMVCHSPCESSTIFRAARLAYYYGELGNFAQELFYAKAALDLVHRSNDTQYLADAERLVTHASEALESHKLTQTHK